jgi:CubicO group peptidase (beta-lactamase class C family)
MVFKDGETIYHETSNSGMAGDAKINAGTLFPVWSMSKPITTVGMLILHERGLFDWNDPVSKYLPCFAGLTLRDGDTVRPVTEPLRIVHLMTHRSGFTYYTAAGPPSYAAASPTQTRFNDLQQFVEVAARTPVNFEPGSDFAYGINQAILGRLAEVLSGQAFAEYLEEVLFAPLDMTETSFVLDAERRSRFQPLYINSGALKGFTGLLDELTYSESSRAHFGGEGLVSSMGDYAAFCEMLLGGGEFRGRRIVSEASLTSMTSPWTEDFDPAGAPGFDMGFGVFVMDESGLEGSLAPKGIFGWSGYHNTHFWIDPASNLFGLFMSRAREFNFEIPLQMRVALYGE